MTGSTETSEEVNNNAGSRSRHHRDHGRLHRRPAGRRGGHHRWRDARLRYEGALARRQGGQAHLQPGRLTNRRRKAGSRGVIVALLAFLLAPAIVLTGAGSASALVPPPIVPVAVGDAVVGADGLAGSIGLICATGVGCAAAGALVVAGGLYLTRDTWLPWVINLLNDPGPGTGPGSTGGNCQALISWQTAPGGSSPGVASIVGPSSCN